MPTVPPRVTARDVAEEAGVSKTTVSYVLNKTADQSIPEGTRKRVLDAVQALGYSPSPTARALRTGRDDTVLILLPDWPITGPISLILDSLLGRLDIHGLSVKTIREDRVSAFSYAWVQTAPRAVVAMHELSSELEELLTARGIVVVHARLAGHQHSPSVVAFPQEQVGILQVRHLASTGRRRIGYAAPKDARMHSFSTLRIAGSRNAASDLGLAKPLVEYLNPTLDSAVRLLERWRALPNPVDGIAAYNDLFAAALLAAAQQLQIAVPEQVAVVGVDNEPLSAFTSPPLTSVEQRSEVIAAALASRIVSGVFDAPLADLPAPPDAFSLIVRRSA